MAIYLIIFLAAVVWYYMDSSKQQRTNAKDSTLGLMVFMTFLALFVGFADMLGGFDRYIYGQLFDSMADQITVGDYNISDSDVAEQYYHEYGYQIYNFILALITENRYTFIIITTFIIYFLLFKSIKKYCSNYPIAVILFLGLWFFFTFTYHRQVLGATIAWLAIQYVVERDLKKFLLVTLIAVSFHNSAIIFLPLYWIPIRKFSKKSILAIMAIALVIGASGASSILFNAYSEVDEERASIANDESGFRVAYLIEAILFLYIIFKNYKDIPNKPINIVLLNMAIIFCGILLFFIRNANAGRLSWYYMIGLISTITYVCTYSKAKNLTITMMVLSFILYYRILATWGIMLYPYKSIFTNGTRENDPIEIEFEYDHNYNYDKFYRPTFRFLEKR